MNKQKNVFHVKLHSFYQGDDAFTKSLDQFVCVAMHYLRYCQSLLRKVASRQRVSVDSSGWVTVGFQCRLGQSCCFSMEGLFLCMIEDDMET